MLTSVANRVGVVRELLIHDKNHEYRHAAVRMVKFASLNKALSFRPEHVVLAMVR